VTVPKTKKNSTPANATSATVGYEAELWQMADALRGSMDAAEYKHVVLGLIFLKYISDAFEEQHAKLEAERAQGADPEDPDEYRGAEHPESLAKQRKDIHIYHGDCNRILLDTPCFRR
jgi:type I restriction enzyme M protein